MKTKAWVNQDLKFDTAYADDDSSVYTIYGSGTLLLLDTNHTIKTFSNTFSLHNDSMAWGEPGIILTLGKWKEEGETIIATEKLIERTFTSSADPIGREEVVQYELKGDTLICNKGKKYLPAGLLTKEISDFLNKDWENLYKKNSR